MFDDDEELVDPQCEVCGKHDAVSWCLFDVDTDQQAWKYVCDCTLGKEDHHITIDKTQGEGDIYSMYLELSRKSWFDKYDFTYMIARYFSAAGLPEADEFMDEFQLNKSGALH